MPPPRWSHQRLSPPSLALAVSCAYICSELLAAYVGPKVKLLLHSYLRKSAKASAFSRRGAGSACSCLLACSVVQCPVSKTLVRTRNWTCDSACPKKSHHCSAAVCVLGALPLAVPRNREGAPGRCACDHRLPPATQWLRRQSTLECQGTAQQRDTRELRLHARRHGLPCSLLCQNRRKAPHAEQAQSTSHKRSLCDTAVPAIHHPTLGVHQPHTT